MDYWRKILFILHISLKKLCNNSSNISITDMMFMSLLIWKFLKNQICSNKFHKQQKGPISICPHYRWNFQSDPLYIYRWMSIEIRVFISGISSAKSVVGIPARIVITFENRSWAFFENYWRYSCRKKTLRKTWWELKKMMKKIF